MTRDANDFWEAMAIGLVTVGSLVFIGSLVAYVVLGYWWITAIFVCVPIVAYGLGRLIMKLLDR